MKIAIASDLSGFSLKQALVKHLKDKGHEVLDFGIPSETEIQPYYIQAPKVARAVQKGEAERGILCCGTGQGMAIVANKFKGIYACVTNDIFSGERSKIVNNANVITLGGWIVAPFVGAEIVDAWLTMEFCQKMEARREWLTNALAEVKNLEKENFK